MSRTGDTMYIDDRSNTSTFKDVINIKMTFHARYSNHLAAGVGLGHNERGRVANFYLGMYICIEKNLLLRNRSDRKVVTHI